MIIELDGTLALTRSIVHRDRVRILIWILSIVTLVVLTVASVEGLFPTQASLDSAAAASHNAAVIVFNGPPQGLHTLGGEVAFQMGAMGMVVVALMSLFTIGRLTRADEEAGRLELVRSLPVGRHAPTVAAAVVATAMALVVGGLTTVVLVVQGLPLVGALVFGISFVLIALFFGAFALLIAQVTQNARVVYGAGGVAVGAAFAVRAVGDVDSGGISWLSPIGMAQKARPWAGERWWPFLPLLASIGLLLGVAFVLASRRDLGRGIVEPRSGPATGSAALGRPLGLAVRLQRASVVGWGAGVAVAAAAYGSVAPTIDAFVRDNRELAKILAPPGSPSLTDAYFATSFRILALLVAAFAIQSALRPRAEESTLRAESVLATPVARWRWAMSHLSIAVVGSVVLLLVAGLAAALADAVAGGAIRSVPRLASSALVYAPAVWVLVGVAVVLIGVAPRGSAGVWGVLTFCFVIGLLGPVLDLPDWVEKVSPFERVPSLPGGALSAVPLVAMTVIAAALILAGLFGLRARDLALHG